MKTKLLMLAFVAMIFAGCSVDQDETVLENATIELTQEDNSRNGWTDGGPGQINPSSICKNSGTQVIRIKFNFPFGGSSGNEIWKQGIRDRFEEYGLARADEKTSNGETWHFVLQDMTPERAAIGGCRNDIVRNAIRSDKDVDIDNNHSCIGCNGW